MIDMSRLNQILGAYEAGETLSDAELDWLESAVLSGQTGDIARAGLPLFGMRPKTVLFESNFYELEAVRVLAISGRGERLREPVDRIAKRLHQKCYGHFCPTGECFEASVCVLRFLCAVCPAETAWIEQLEKGIRTHHGNKIRTRAARRYIDSALGA